uniref:Uncharacterized protein n=1 Tax=Hemiselmis andersenii TaxID=464988 RepID=A0A6T8PBY2_HEMAN|mmetsp:Transcript_4348/g.10303  ORF Transcript_4348/g.10303 Transcript_4348/m.10303 type:complete len:110 (+) Transcript_4348:61-390(+)
MGACLSAAAFVEEGGLVNEGSVSEAQEKKERARAARKAKHDPYSGKFVDPEDAREKSRDEKLREASMRARQQFRQDQRTPSRKELNEKKYEKKMAERAASRKNLEYEWD